MSMLSYYFSRELCLSCGASATVVWLVADFCRPILVQELNMFNGIIAVL